MALQGDAPPGPHAGLGQIPKVGTPPRGGFRAAARSRGGLAGRVSRNNLSNVTSISGSMATRTPAHPARTPKPPGAGSGGGSPPTPTPITRAHHQKKLSHSRPFIVAIQLYGIIL